MLNIYLKQLLKSILSIYAKKKPDSHVFLSNILHVSNVIQSIKYLKY
jgi:hypothetical protein